MSKRAERSLGNSPEGGLANGPPRKRVMVVALAAGLVAATLAFGLDFALRSMPFAELDAYPERSRSVDPLAVARAAFTNLISGRIVSGASTISMQLARIVGPHQHGYREKLMESFNALRLEARLGKDAVLEKYLERIPFGRGNEGIDSAARYYFGKEARELTANEAIVLSVVPRRPSALHPHENTDTVINAALAVADRAGLERNAQDLEESIEHGERRARAFRIQQHEHHRLSPHFQSKVAFHLSEEQRRSGGTVETTLDLDMQRA